MSKQKIHDIIIKKKRPSIKMFARKEPTSTPPPKQSRKSKKERGWFAIFGKGKLVFMFVVFFLIIVLSTKAVDLFAKTIIQVKLHQENITVDTILKAGKLASSDLPFETMELQIVKEKSTEATGTKTIASKASGQIRVYNAFSSQPQKLIATTRFETPDGKIYRIKKSIIVPGAKIENGKIKPNYIETTIYADKPGDKYNIGLTDFTIPGFAGGPRYEKFYARSATAMTGGFEGEVPVVSDKDKNDLKTELENSIKDELLKKALIQTPEEFLIYRDAIQITFTEHQVEGELDPKNPLYTLKETGNLFAVLISEKDLSRVLVKKYLGEESKDQVEVMNLEKLSFELISLDTEKQSMVFKIKGEAEFIWTIDEEKLKEALIATPKNLEDVFKSYPAIDSAAVVFKPSWWRFFPDKTSKIRIEKIAD